MCGIGALSLIKTAQYCSGDISVNGLMLNISLNQQYFTFNNKFILTLNYISTHLLPGNALEDGCKRMRLKSLKHQTEVSIMGDRCLKV